ncbi:MAG: hypothetical protein K0S46_2271 [Moraxellaceae bacterium]|jgi:putative endonuclease|nr:hypothetical protein [Moraxellaceae bacterium]
MSWFLYVLECSDGSLYTGITVDVRARFDAHAAGRGARYTRARPPVRVVAMVAFPDRSTASKAEHEVKRLPLQRKRAFCAEHPPVDAIP